MGIAGLEHERGYKDDGRRVWHAMSKALVESFSMEKGSRMVMKFLDIFAGNLDKAFPKTENSTDWVSVDLRNLIMKQSLIAGISSFFGSHLVDSWPTLFEDFWTYQEYVFIHLSQMPRILAPKAYASRRKILDILLRWEQDAHEHRDLDQLLASDVDSDEYWGARVVWRIIKLGMKNGLSEEGRASILLSLLSGRGENTVPITFWMMVQCLVEPDVKSRVCSAIDSCQNSEDGFNLHRLVTHSYLKSFFLETLRCHVGAPSMRQVLKTTQIGEYTFHKGNVVHIVGRELHMNDKIWFSNGAPKDSSEFWAERFLDMDSDKNGKPIEKHQVEPKFSKAAADAISAPIGARSKPIRDRMASLRVFGGGDHLCPGRHLGLRDTIGAMATLFTMFDIEMDEEALQVIGMPDPDTHAFSGFLPDRKFMIRMKRK
ncbi:hypothetical protein PRK78_003767 [Emydomyces testavorans]|uniref:Cytochrome P450 n=1 Tax=Emydomyces testavorans TaxID=2070801 RepID=A0AAF0DGL8_9EURO|nr:hypothetical protein PRK78_003767 [Emydomyces testavorans]